MKSVGFTLKGNRLLDTFLVQKRLCCQIPIGLLNAAYYPHPVGIVIFERSRGAIIGANSVVTREVLPYSIVKSNFNEPVNKKPSKRDAL